MFRHTNHLRLSGRTSIVAIAATAALAGSMLAAPTAQSAAPVPADTECPDAIPVDQVVGGMAVSGLTVSQGTTPEPFTGEILGVLQDGIAPGIDMVVARLSSAAIDSAGGVWAGMSGSPVYAEDGRLVGAVSYGLSNGASPVAGLTPADAMRAWLDPAPTALTAGPVRLREDVGLPARTAAEIVEEGLATRAEVASGMSQLPLPIAVSGAASPKRLRQISELLGLDDALVYATGGTTAATPAADIVAGGNLAVTLSYGDITYGGVGTATEVCGDEVLAFGHPAFWRGPTTLTMHSADVVYVQDDLFYPYKAANITGATGTITDDRYAAVHGYLGAPPDTTTVAADSSSSEGLVRHGETYVAIPESLPDIATTHLLANLDRVFDGISKGSSRIQLTAWGTLPDGSGFAVTRTDRFASAWDITIDSVFDSYQTLSRVLNNRFTAVTIDTVQFTSFVDREYQEYRIGVVKRFKDGRWVKVDRSQALRVRPGTTLRLQVTLDRVRMAGSRVQVVSLPVPESAAGKRGNLTIAGGNSIWRQQKSTSFEDLLNDIESEVQNNDMVSTLRIERRGPDMLRSERTRLDVVADGWFDARVVVAK